MLAKCMKLRTPQIIVPAMWMLQTVESLNIARLHRQHDVAIAVPARNEAQTILGCLSALDFAATQTTLATISIVVLVNNSNDATAAVARSFVPQAASVKVVEVELAPDDAHAGGARRAALDLCLAELPPAGILMTTDADSRVEPSWITANLAEIEAGADAVAGVVAFDAEARANLPELTTRGLEWRLAMLQARLVDLLDPLRHNPWPSHIWAWGASLSLTAAAYRQVGGLPSVPLAEDRALAEAIERHDLCLRRSHAPVVYTSARRFGRAPGGFADLLSSYLDNPDTPCDAALEPTAVLVRRLRWRARLRRSHASNAATTGAPAAPSQAFAGFGAVWRQLEQQSPALGRRRLLPYELPAEVRRAERLIRWLTSGAARQGDSLPSALAA